MSALHVESVAIGFEDCERRSGPHPYSCPATSAGRRTTPGSPCGTAALAHAPAEAAGTLRPPCQIHLFRLVWLIHAEYPAVIQTLVPIGLGAVIRGDFGTPGAISHVRPVILVEPGARSSNFLSTFRMNCLSTVSTARALQGMANNLSPILRNPPNERTA